MNLIDEMIENIKNGRKHPRHNELSEASDKAIASQEELQHQTASGELTIRKWAKNLIKSMGKFPTDNK